MPMREEYLGKNFRWNYDGVYGVGQFERLADRALSHLETGEDCENRRREFHRLKQKTDSPRYPKTAPTFADVFGRDCVEHIFDT